MIRDVRLGSLLIQQDDETGEPLLFQTALPTCLKKQTTAENTYVLLSDSQIGTAAACIMAIRVLLDHGVKQERWVLSTECNRKRTKPALLPSLSLTMCLSAHTSSTGSSSYASLLLRKVVCMLSPALSREFCFCPSTDFLRVGTLKVACTHSYPVSSHMCVDVWPTTQRSTDSHVSGRPRSRGATYSDPDCRSDYPGAEDGAEEVLGNLAGR